MEYPIGKFAELTGFSVDTLRYYENEGILESSQHENGRHFYDDEALAWAAIITKLKSTGMSLKDIKHYAELTRQGPETIEARMELLFAHSDSLLAERRDLDAKLMTLYDKIEIYNKMLKDWLIENVKKS